MSFYPKLPRCDKYPVPMRPQTVTLNPRLQKQIMHAALWLGLCFAGGLMLVLATYLAAIDQIAASVCTGNERLIGQSKQIIQLSNKLLPAMEQTGLPGR